MNDLRTLYLTKLKKLLSIEEQIIAALPSLIESATNGMLKKGLTDHLEETRNQRARLHQILTAQGESPAPELDRAFQTMLAESETELGTISDPNVKDAAIIASSQAVEHLEMAKYGTAVEWAKSLNFDEDAKLLKDTLGEEEAADKKLSKVAEGGMLSPSVNDAAAE